MDWKVRMFIGMIIFAVVGFLIVVFRAKEEEESLEGIVVLCAGDSITAAGYPGYLQKRFHSLGKNITVLNKGVNGHTSGEYLQYMKSVSLLEETDPDIVLLQLGTNDVRIDGDKTSTVDFTANMREIITLIESYTNLKGKKLELVLGTVPPVQRMRFPFDADSGRRVVEEINPSIMEMVRRQGTAFIDNYQLFIEHPEHLPGIHPDEEGYRLLAENWLSALLPILDISEKNVLRELTGKIVFQSNRDGNWEIYVMNAGGSGLKRLTENESDDEYPVWSPDGEEIAFKSNRDGNWEIYKMNADCSAVSRLTNCEAEDADPCWSPDGEKIAFHSSRDGNWEIYAVCADGGEPVRITKSPHKEILPAWSPDGRKISFTGNRLFGWQVYVMDADGNKRKRLTNQKGACRSDWSPDGSKIAYVSSHADRKGDIWVMNPDGTDKKRLTIDSANYDYYPAWSRDGKKIVFAKSSDKRTGNWEIWVMNADGSCPVRITCHSGQDKFPDWF